MTKGDKAMEAAEAAMRAGQPSLAGAIIAADALGMDPNDPHIMEAAWLADVQTRRALGTDGRPSKPGKTAVKRG